MRRQSVIRTNCINNIIHLEVSVDDASRVHMFQSKDHLTGIETNLVLKERAVL